MGQEAVPRSGRGSYKKKLRKRFGLYPACLFSKLWHNSKCLTSLQNCFQILLPLRPPAFFFYNCFETSRRLSSATLFVQVASNRPLWHENVRISCGTTGAALGGWVSIDEASNSLSYLPRGGYYLSDHRLREKWNGLMVELTKAAWRLDGPLSRRVDGVDVTPGERWGEEKEMFYDYLPTRWRKRFLWADVITRRRKITINLLNITKTVTLLQGSELLSYALRCLHVRTHSPSHEQVHLSFFLSHWHVHASTHTHTLTGEMCFEITHH